MADLLSLSIQYLTPIIKLKAVVLCLASIMDIARSSREQQADILRVEDRVGQVPVVFIPNASDINYFKILRKYFYFDIPFHITTVKA